MKIRAGFVSNSSSSSYVCDVSGEAFEVHDDCFWDAGLCQCPMGHVFQKKFLVKWERKYPSRDEMLSKLDEVTDSKRECMEFRRLTDSQLKQKYLEITEGYQGNNANVNECPICTMTFIKDSDLIKYMLKKQGLTREELVVQIRAEFDNNFPAFLGWIECTKKN